MPVNLIESIQRNLGWPALRKIDPNTQETNQKSKKNIEENLAQSAIPAITAGLYKFSRNTDNCKEMLRGKNSTEWVKRFFGDGENELVYKVASYSGTSLEETRSHLKNVADQAISIAINSIPEKPTPVDLENFVSAQRNLILQYLPAELQIGVLLDDSSMDDRTNKMRGPVSNFLHAIEKNMSGPGGDLDMKKM